MTRLSTCLAVLILLTLLGCAREGGGETGNPVARTPIALTVRSSDPGVIAIDNEGSGALIEEAWFAFGEVDFLDAERCAQLGEIEARSEVLLAVDLTKPNPGLTLDVARGAYCGMVVPLPLDDAELPEGAPPELEDHSIVLRGTRADGTPFVLSHSEQDELELAAEGGDIAVGDAAFVLSFDVALLMDGVDLDSLEPGDDGTIRITAGANPVQLEAFETNLECALELYEDADADGEIDEADPVRAKCIPEDEESGEL